jgi:hypothetical protein
MDDRPIVACGDRGWRLGLHFFGLVRDLPLAQRDPAPVICTAQNGSVANGYAICLCFIDNAIIERHGLGRGFINPGVMKPALIQNGHGKNSRGDDTGRVCSDFNHGGSPQLVRFTPLRHCRGESCGTHQHKDRAGQEPASAI